MRGSGVWREQFWGDLGSSPMSHNFQMTPALGQVCALVNPYAAVWYATACQTTAAVGQVQAHAKPAGGWLNDADSVLPVRHTLGAGARSSEWPRNADGNFRDGSRRPCPHKGVQVADHDTTPCNGQAGLLDSNARIIGEIHSSKIIRVQEAVGVVQSA